MLMCWNQSNQLDVLESLQIGESIVTFFWPVCDFTCYSKLNR